MNVMKMRNTSKLLLAGSLLLTLIVLVLAAFAPWYIVVPLAGVSVLMVIGFIVLTLVYWRCPSCKLRFKMYDLELEQSRVCPRCGVHFDDPNACNIEYIPDGQDDTDDEDDEEE